MSHKSLAILLPFYLMLTNYLAGQNNVIYGTLNISCKITGVTDLPIDSCNIIIYDDYNKNILIQGSSNSRGRYKYTLDLDKEYTIEFQKKGYTSKNIKIYTQIVIQEYLNEDYVANLDVVLFKTIKDDKKEKSSKYAGIIIWDEEIKEFNYDEEKYRVFQEEQDRLRKEAMLLAIQDKLKKETEALAEIEKIKQEAQRKIEEEMIRKEMEAQQEIEKLRAENESRKNEIINEQDQSKILTISRDAKVVTEKEEMVKVVKKAEEIANTIKIKLVADAAIDSINMMKEAESKATKEYLMQLADAKAKENLLGGKFDNQTIDKEKLMNKWKDEAEARYRKDQLEIEAKSSTEILLVLENAKKKVNEINKSKAVQAVYTNELFKELDKMKEKESSIVIQKKAEIWKNKKPFEKVDEFKPEVIKKTEESMFSTTNYTIIKYPGKNDTLQFIDYLFGEDEFLKNSKKINNQLYNQELVRINKQTQ